MASLHERNGWFHVFFRLGGQQTSIALKTKDRKDAEALLGGVEKVLFRIEQGFLEMPPGCDLRQFLLSDGKATHKPNLGNSAGRLTLGELCERYLDVHGNGAMESNSLATVRLHLNHFRRTLGERCKVQDLTTAALQEHVTRRSKKKLSPVTLKKEMASLRACWNWGAQTGLVSGPFPNKGLRYPKTEEKPPFQTRERIERRVARGGLTKKQIQELWDSLFLALEEVTEFLEFVRQNAYHPFI